MPVTAASVSPRRINPPAGCTAMAIGSNHSGMKRVPKMVPEPSNSRMQDKSVIASVKPNPMPRPSAALRSGGFLKAKASARAKMMQLTRSGR